jgi:hypothetical protein
MNIKDCKDCSALWTIRMKESYCLRLSETLDKISKCSYCKSKKEDKKNDNRAKNRG